MKALVGAFNQEKALVGAFTVIVQPVVEPMDRFTALIISSSVVAVPKCYDVPKVECFHVLSPAPDLACAPRAVQECMDTVKEVPYLYPQEKCYDVPREECRDITEQVPYLYLHIST